MKQVKQNTVIPLLALAAAVAPLMDASAEARRVMNIVNFMRGCDPRHPDWDMTKVLKEEVWFNQKFHLKNTILLQYDAMLRKDLMDVALSSDPELTEFGLWFELVRPLCDATGITWRGRPGWDWDWHACPTFLMAYTPEERERLCDEMMRLFKEKFGRLPESVGSWILDAHSMAYMSEKYGVKAFCICREQDNTDAEGLRGGYSNGAYYPSRRNMLSAARDMKNGIRTPVFRMLTPDPIYNYGRPQTLYDGPRQLISRVAKRECPTLEPVWYGGNNRETVDWYFDTYLRSPGLLNLSYMSTGQENGFEWERVSMGLGYQMMKIKWERDEHGLIVETLAETGKRFIADHPENCPQTQVAVKDWSGYDRRSVWYNSRFYRGNLFIEGERLCFRDIHAMRDDFDEPYLDTACHLWEVNYFTPPLVDTWMDRGDREKSETERGDMVFEGAFVALGVETPDDKTLAVTATRTDGSVVRIVFSEDRVSVSGSPLVWELNANRRAEIAVEDGRLVRTFHGYRLPVGLTGRAEKTDGGYRILPTEKEIVFGF